MEDIEIRNGCFEDYTAVEEIMKQVQSLHVGWRPDIYKHCDTVLTEEAFRKIVESGTLLVAEVNQKVAGVLIYLVRHVESVTQVTRDVLFVDSVAVDEKYRGKGVGHKFFERLKEIREENNYDGIELQVNARNTAARRMYEGCGFTEKSINMELL